MLTISVPHRQALQIPTHQALKLLIDMNSPLIAETLCKENGGQVDVSKLILEQKF
jgi:hypothetical protein